MKGTSLNIAFCSFELGLTQGKRVQLLPHGNFRSTDGRPEKIPHWTMNASIAAKLIEIVGERKNDLVIDFEHQTLMTAKNGQPAPAAGWFKEMEYEDGVGLFATDVRWVGDTEAMIAKEEYKYLSLVFPYDNNGVPLDIFHAGLTNAPAIDGMDDIQVMAAKFFSTESTEDNTMNELLILLGLAATATETEAVAALTLLIDDSKKYKTDIIGFGEQIAALKAGTEKNIDKVDHSKYVSVEVVEELKTEIAVLKSNANESEVNDLVDAAMSEGKILPAQENWARKLGTDNIAALKTYIDETPAIAALKGKQTIGKNLDENGEVVLDENQLAVCKQLGVSAEDYKKTLKAEATA